ncbi:hypothetical protein L6Q21_11470 [Sandaracinobacter sp. RS1-74]|nr:hypothetical protein [Sandaracinobacteroides sayramensis]
MEQSWRSSACLALLLTLGIGAPLFALADWSAGLDVPLQRDYAALSRILVAMPLLLATLPLFDSMIDRALDHPERAGLLSGANLARQRRWAARLRRLRCNRVVIAGMILVAFAGALLQPWLPGPLRGLEGWGYSASGKLNLAGGWYCFLFLPIFRLLMLLWLWRLLLWLVLLGSLGFLRPRLNPAHPDGAGGLGYLGFVQQRLSPLLVAGGFMMAGSAANRIAHLGETVGDLILPLVGYVVIYPLLLLLPLFLTTPLLLRSKRNGLFDYALIGHSLSRAFEESWVSNPMPPAEQLQSPNPSALADFGAVHATVTDMRFLPIRPWGIAAMVLSAGAPLLLLVFLQVPLEQLLRIALAELPPLDLIPGGL